MTTFQLYGLQRGFLKSNAVLQWAAFQFKAALQHCSIAAAQPA
jgi:hypothetical protein